MNTKLLLITALMAPVFANASSLHEEKIWDNGWFSEGNITVSKKVDSTGDVVYCQLRVQADDNSGVAVELKGTSSIDLQLNGNYHGNDAAEWSYTLDKNPRKAEKRGLKEDVHGDAVDVLITEQQLLQIVDSDEMNITIHRGRHHNVEYNASLSRLDKAVHEYMQCVAKN